MDELDGQLSYAALIESWSHSEGHHNVLRACVSDDQILLAHKAWQRYVGPAYNLEDVPST